MAHISRDMDPIPVEKFVPSSKTPATQQSSREDAYHVSFCSCGMFGNEKPKPSVVEYQKMEGEK